MPVRKTHRYKSRPQSERAFQAQVIALAKLTGWRIYHTYDSRRSEPGFPDLILIRGSVLLAIELKSETGKPTAEQLAWLGSFAGVQRVESSLWRPSDWDTIQATLAK